MDNRMEKKSGVQIDVLSIIRDVCRQGSVILLLSVSVALLAYVFVSERYQPEYTTTSTFVVTAKGMNNNIYQNLSSAQSMAEQFSQVLGSHVLQQKVAEDLGEGQFTAVTSAEILPETNLMVLSVTADSALESFRGIRSIMENYNTVSDFVMDNVILEVLQEPQIPMAPSNSPNAGDAAKKAFAAAFTVCVLGFAVLSYMKDTVKNVKEVPEKIDARLLGVIYHERKAKSLREIKNARSFSLLIDNPLLSFRFVESNRMSASRIRSHMAKKDVKVLLVTSVAENEGKSTVAANLALALAQENKNVVLIDYDFRKPAQYKIFGTTEEETSDLSAILLSNENEKLQGIIRKYKDSSLFTVLNKTPVSSIEPMTESGKLKWLTDFFRTRMDYVILDTSPIGMVADTEEIAQYADASILVIQQDLVLAGEINDAVDILNTTKGKVLGCIFNNVINGDVTGIGRYGYGYGGHYGKYGKRTE